MNIEQIQDRQKLIRSLKNDNKMTFAATGKRLGLSRQMACSLYWQDVKYLKRQTEPRRIFIKFNGKPITLLARY